MRIAVSGAAGLIGSALVPGLEACGHDVVRLVRRDARDAKELGSGFLTDVGTPGKRLPSPLVLRVSAS